MKNTKSELKDNELEIICGGERFNEITIGDITGTLSSTKDKAVLKNEVGFFPGLSGFP